MHPWISALLAIDEDRNKKPLVDLLTSHTRLPRAARWHIADLLKRYELTRPRGGRSTPSYDLSPAETKLRWASDSADHSIRNGMAADKAVELAAKTHGVKSKDLFNYRAGKYRSAWRMKSRRPPSGQRRRAVSSNRNVRGQSLAVRS
jgi:hypothetical protein